MIPIKPHIWHSHAAYDAAAVLDTEIDVYMVHDGMGVVVLDERKSRAWVDEYVRRCITRIKGEGPEVVT